MHPLENLAEPIADQTTANGSANAAQLDLGPLRQAVDVFVDCSAAAQLTVEASADGSTWRTFDTVSYSGATTSMEQFDVAYPHVRASLDTGTNVVEVASKGLD